jgi:hypothetical protein
VVYNFVDQAIIIQIYKKIHNGAVIGHNKPIFLDMSCLHGKIMCFCILLLVGPKVKISDIAYLVEHR